MSPTYVFQSLKCQLLEVQISSSTRFTTIVFFPNKDPKRSFNQKRALFLFSSQAKTDIPQNVKNIPDIQTVPKKQGSFINLTCVALSLPGLPIDVDWFHKDKVSYHLIDNDVMMFMIIEEIIRKKQ